MLFVTPTYAFAGYLALTTAAGIDSIGKRPPPSANIVNVDSALMANLQGHVPPAWKGNPPEPGSAGFPLKKFSIVSVDVTEADLLLDDTHAVVLPVKRYFDVYTNANCTTERRGWSETLRLTKQVQLSRSASWTQTFVSASSLTAHLDFPKVGGLGGSVSRTVTLNDQSGWSETENESSESSRTIDMQVQPGQVLAAKIERTVSSIREPFHGRVTVTGVVSALYAFDARLPIHGHPPVHFEHVEQYAIDRLLPNDSARSFSVNGFLENSSADNLDVIFAERPADKTRDCGISNAGLGGTHRVNGSRKVVTSSTTKARAVRPFVSKGALASQDEAARFKFNDLTVEEYRDDVTIHTADAIATVSVRHMSLGPGFCAVETHSDRGSTVGQTAPPGVWGAWQVIETIWGKQSLTLTDDVKCDTGVRSQVQYAKDTAYSPQ